MIYKDIVKESMEKLEIMQELTEEIANFNALVENYDDQLTKAWNSFPSSGASWSSSTCSSLSQLKNVTTGYITGYRYEIPKYYGYLFKLENYCQKLSAPNEISEFKEAFECFLNNLDSFLNDKKSPNLIPPLLIAIRGLVVKYDQILGEVKRVQMYDIQLENQPHSSNGETLELQFYDKMEISEIVYILEAIPDLYSRGLRVLSLEEAEYPLEIIKFESGTWYTKFFGHAAVIALLNPIFSIAIKDAYNSYSTHPVAKARREEAIYQHLEKQLDVRAKLQEQGFDTSLLDEDINNYLAKTYKVGKKLAVKSSKIRVNEETIEIKDTGKHKLLEEKQKDLFIEYNHIKESEDLDLDLAVGE